MKNVEVLKEKIQKMSPEELANALEKFNTYRCFLCRYHYEQICGSGSGLVCEEGYRLFLEDENYNYRATDLQQALDFYTKP